MATMSAWEVPVLPTPLPDVEPTCRPRHRKPFSPLSVRLGDDLRVMWERTGVMIPRLPRHRADVAVMA